MDGIMEYLPYGLEIARQLYDARKPLYVTDIALQWDADVPLQGTWILTEYVQPFETIGALRHHQGRIFLPRRRQRECPYHNEICIPTREDAFHHALACDLYKQLALGRTCPTFLVDLLDPWPRGIPAPSSQHIRNHLLPAALRYHILQRDGFRCQACGASPTDSPGIIVQVDHKISRAHGGTDDPSNLITLCALCNQGKGMQDM